MTRTDNASTEPLPPDPDADGVLGAPNPDVVDQPSQDPTSALDDIDAAELAERGS